MMGQHSLRATWIALAVLAFPATGNCAPNVGPEGVYVNATGLASLDLKSGGQAVFTMMSEIYACTYKLRAEKIVLDCTPQGRRTVFAINGDGSLTGPGEMGVLRRTK